MSKSAEKLPNFLLFLRLVPIAWIAVAAWPFGGATWYSQYWLNITAFFVIVYTAILLTGLRAKPQFSRLSMLFLLTLTAVGCWSALQTVPIAPAAPLRSLFHSIALQDSYLVPDNSSGIQQNPAALASPPRIPSPQSVSVDRGHTLAALPNIGSAIVAFAVGYLLIGPSTRAACIAFGIMLANTALVAGIGIAEDIAADKWQLLGIEMQTAFGPFVSRNSAAMFLNIGIACGFALLACLPKSKSNEGVDPTYRYSTNSPTSRIIFLIENLAADISSIKVTVGALVVLIFVGVLVSLSRGGMASSIVGFALIFIGSFFHKRRIEGGLLTCLVLAISIALIVWLDQLDLVSSRVETVTDGNAVYEDARWKVWRFAFDAFSHLWLTGGGLGNFHYSYLPFQSEPVATWFYHAESFYWQVAVDLGLTGVLAIVSGGTLLFCMIRKLANRSSKRESQRLLPSAIFLFTTLSLHSIVEFSLILPGIYLPACLMSGIFFAMSDQTIRNRSRRKRRTVVRSDSTDNPVGSCRFTLVPVSCIIAASIPLLFSTVVIGPRAKAEALEQQLRVWQHDQENAQFALDSIIEAGENALRSAPNDGQLNMTLAKAYTDKFRWLTLKYSPSTTWKDTNPILLRLRYFERTRVEQLNLSILLNNKEQEEALVRSFECWSKAHRNLALDWRPQLALAELDFVEIENQQTQFFLENLKTLAFNRPKVLTSAGLIALAYPGKDLSFEILKRALESSPSQLRLIFPIAYKNFGLRVLNEAFLPEDPLALLELIENDSIGKSAPQLSEGLWKKIQQSLPNLSDNNRQKPILLAKLYRALGNRTLEIASLRQAITNSPLETDLRLKYAKALFEDKQLKQALEQVETCLRQTPESEEAKLLKKTIENHPTP